MRILLQTIRILRDELGLPRRTVTKIENVAGRGGGFQEIHQTFNLPISGKEEACGDHTDNTGRGP